jgi:hypothetical protein
MNKTHKLTQEQRRKTPNAVKDRLLSKNAMPFEVEGDWFILEARKKMVVWMEGYFDEVYSRLPESETKYRMAELKETFEGFKVHHQAIVREFYSRHSIQDLMKKEKKELAIYLSNLKDAPGPYKLALFKAYDYGGIENVPDEVWRKVVYTTKYHQ